MTKAKEEEEMTIPQRNFITANFQGYFGSLIYKITKTQARLFIGEVILAQNSHSNPIERQRAKNKLADQLYAKLQPNECKTCSGSLIPGNGQACHC